MSDVEELYYWLKSSKVRLPILQLLNNANIGVCTSDIHNIYGFEKSQIIHILNDFTDKGIAEQVSKNSNRNRFFKITDKGKEVLKIYRINNEKLNKLKEEKK